MRSDTGWFNATLTGERILSLLLICHICFPVYLYYIKSLCISFLFMWITVNSLLAACIHLSCTVNTLIIEAEIRLFPFLSFRCIFYLKNILICCLYHLLVKQSSCLQRCAFSTMLLLWVSVKFTKAETQFFYHKSPNSSQSLITSWSAFDLKLLQEVLRCINLKLKNQQLNTSMF